MIEKYIESFSEVIKSTIVTTKDALVQEHSSSYMELADILEEVHNNKGTIYLVGNGGSSGVISHASIDLINACKLRAFPMTDNSVLTCLANDYGYENVFSEGLKTLFTSNDLLIAVSSSGSSKNICNAAETASTIGGKVVTFSGFKSDNALRKLGDHNFWLNSEDYGKVEIGHALLIHILTDELYRRRNNK
jgi:D-sedoheptulose 7-phosphate isomerase